MGKFLTDIESDTRKATDAVSGTKVVKEITNVLDQSRSYIEDGLTLASRAVIFSLSTAWAGISIIRPATTEKKNVEGDTADSYLLDKDYFRKNAASSTPTIDRYDTTQMWSVQLGEYFLPMSQTYSVSASKKINVSSLVDGIDIIQQTRKEAKTIDCTLKISMNENQSALQIQTRKPGADAEIAKLNAMLFHLYEKDKVFSIDNEMINKTLLIYDAIMTKYKFMPRAGSKVFIFEFTLMEVKFGDNVLTFDEEGIQKESTTLAY